MDQDKIGKFIAKSRKDKNMTQEQLAEKLGVNSKSISRWENGKCMPDISLLIPLSKNLEVSVNDLLSGKNVDKKDYQETFEENILNVMTTVERTNKMYKKFLKVLVFIIIIFLLLCTIFGIIDYFRAINGKKPIFTYNIANVSPFDVEIALSVDDILHSKGITDVGIGRNVIVFKDAELNHPNGAIYYGIGYAISTCDIETGNYSFKLGNKKEMICSTSLSCTKTFDKNDIHSFEYDFFEDKLVRITTTLTIPADEIENVETYEKEFMKIYDVSGCNGYFSKLDETTYITTQACVLSNMSNSDVQSVYSTTKDSLIQTRDEIIDSYSYDKEMICE